MSTSNIKGVSVIICCYNSVGRITATLQAMAAQRVQETIAWELIVVDNASTDNTAQMVKDTWKELGAATELRVVHEAQPGLGFARKKGISEAHFSFILFCDDDNWLCARYIQGIYDILDNDPAIAACGGMGIPVFENQKPPWFDEYQEVYAVGPQSLNEENGQLLNLYGAGLAMRKNLYEQLFGWGFKPFMSGRVGKKLSSSEDTELTYAFVLMGYKLHYAPELTFQHYLPQERLTLDYLKKIYVAFGADGPVRNLYYAHISKRIFHKRIRSWSFHVLLSLFRLVKYFILPPKKGGRMIYTRWCLAYMKELFSIRKPYNKILVNISTIQIMAQSAHTRPEFRAPAYS
jgi:glycosyltransferase involved in cell wall biosynthesis